MKSSELLLNKIIDFEGCKLTAYKCPAGVWTIGVGHTKGVKQGQTITEKQAMSLLKGDLLPCETYVNNFTSAQPHLVAPPCSNTFVKASQSSISVKNLPNG